MSGYISSGYSLSPAEIKRQQEERERRLEEEKCQLLERSIDTLRNKLLFSIEQLKQKTDKSLDQAKALVPESYTIDKIEKTVNLLLNQVNEFPSDFGTRNSGNMSIYMSRMETVFQNIASTEEGILDNCMKNLDKEVEEHKINNAEAEFLSNADVMKPVQRQQFNLNATIVSANPPKDTINLDKILIEFNNSADLYISNCYLSNNFKSEIQKLKESIQQTICDERTDGSDKLEGVRMRHRAFLTTCKKYDQDIKDNQRQLTEFNNLHLTYLSLCNMANKIPKEYTFEINKDGIDVINKLNNEIELCRAKLAKKEESEYISRSINEVMEEIGCEIVATDFLSRPDSDVIQNIYKFEKGNVINVFTSDKGSLMFEVTGVKEKNELTEMEKLKIKESMESFCKKYDLIRTKLNERGIGMPSEIIEPAHVRYAKSIDISKKKQVKTRQKTGMQRNHQQQHCK